MTISELNTQFSIAGHVLFKEGTGRLPIAEITNHHASASISLYGAHILSYRPQRQPDVLWVSNKSFFEAGKPIRGGIPLCFPWFGPHAADPKKPMHGFARLSMWHVLKTESLQDDSTKIVLGLQDSDATRAILPIHFSAEATFIIGKQLEVSLSVTNTDTSAIQISDALHTYFHIGSIDAITIDGLHHASFYDGPGGTALQQQQEARLAITKEENRRYINTTSDCLIHDQQLHRIIRAAKRGSHVTVVWNPWSEMSKTMADMGADEYKTFVCVEAVNAYNDIITLEPHANHTIAVVLSVE